RRTGVVRAAGKLRGARRHDEPRAVVAEFDALTEADVAPWYHAQISAARVRFAEIEALREGREPPPPSDELGRHLLSLFTTMVADPDAFRAALEYVATITPVQQIVRRPDVAEVIRLASDAMQDSPSIVMPGPDRRALLDLVT